MKKQTKVPVKRAAVAMEKPTRYIGESHDYDSNRPKRPTRSRYKGAAGAAY